MSRFVFFLEMRGKRGSKCRPRGHELGNGLVWAALLLLLTGGVASEARAQQDAAVSFPMSVASEVADSTTTLTLGLDPEATSGIDSVLGEVEHPPRPPASFDARLVDTNIEADLGEGVLVDIRPGDDSTAGARTRELVVVR